MCYIRRMFSLESIPWMLETQVQRSKTLLLYSQKQVWLGVSNLFIVETQAELLFLFWKGFLLNRSNHLRICFFYGMTIVGHVIISIYYYYIDCMICAEYKCCTSNNSYPFAKYTVPSCLPCALSFTTIERRWQIIFFCICYALHCLVRQISH